MISELDAIALAAAPSPARLRPMDSADRSVPIVVWYAQQKRWAIVYWVKARKVWIELAGSDEAPAGWVDVLPESPA